LAKTRWWFKSRNSTEPRIANNHHELVLRGGWTTQGTDNRAGTGTIVRGGKDQSRHLDLARGVAQLGAYSKLSLRELGLDPRRPATMGMWSAPNAAKRFLKRRHPTAMYPYVEDASRFSCTAQGRGDFASAPDAFARTNARAGLRSKFWGLMSRSGR